MTHHPIRDLPINAYCGEPMKIYLAGPMTGIPHFNYPAFNAAAAALRSHGHTVFNPAEHDTQMFGKDISNPEGDAEKAAADHGFDRRAALKADLVWICENADGIALLPGWEKSTGACAEKALSVALSLKVVAIPDHVGPANPECRNPDGCDRSHRMPSCRECSAAWLTLEPSERMRRRQEARVAE